nr:uncharacterized protein LOC124808512 [Hydra vulgaris]
MITPLAEFIESIKEEKLVDFLQQKRLMPLQKLCLCGQRMLLQNYERCQEKHIWRCNTCKKTKSIRAGFFESSTSLSKISLKKICKEDKLREDTFRRSIKKR